MHPRAVLRTATSCGYGGRVVAAVGDTQRISFAGGSLTDAAAKPRPAALANGLVEDLAFAVREEVVGEVTAVGLDFEVA